MRGVDVLTASSAVHFSEMQPMTSAARSSCFLHWQAASVTSQPTLGAPSLMQGTCEFG